MYSKRRERICSSLNSWWKQPICRFRPWARLRVAGHQFSSTVCAHLCAAHAGRRGTHMMKLPRRQFLHLAAGAAAIPALSRAATAQAYPTRPITMVVPFPAGGPTDVIGCVLTERMRALLGQPVIVENVAGAAGNLGVGRVSRSSPDGYTIVVGFVGTHVYNGAMYPLQYDVLKDFTPISLIANIPYVIVARKGFPANDLKALIAWLRANPDKASVATGGVGTPQHVSALLFQDITGTRFQFVPYRGAAPAMQDLVGGQVDMMFDS